MSGRLVQSAAAALEDLRLHPPAPRRVGHLVAHDGQMLEVEGLPLPLGTSVSIDVTDGLPVRGEIVGFRNRLSLILPFSIDAAFGVGGQVRCDGPGGMARCGAALIGRVIDAHGDPLDGRPVPLVAEHWPLAGRRVNPLHKGSVRDIFDTGVGAINALLTMGVGQRVAVMAGSGVGKSVLVSQMLAGADYDVAVIGLVGERSREISDFLEARRASGAMESCVIVAVPADQPPLLRLRGAMRATAIAEYFRSLGKRVVLLIDSLTRVAHAQREIGLALGEPPTMKGYPPSAMGLIPRLIERAGCDSRTGGSITAIYTVLADGGDMDDPVIDTARAIVDGHIILSRQMAEQGVFPAIDLSRSLSRVMADIVDADHAEAARRFRRLWSIYEDNRDLLLMGAYAAGTDTEVDTAVMRREDMLGLISQQQQKRVDFATSRAMLVEGFAA